MGQFNGDVAVVTGAAQGIGAAFAEALAAQGARVVIIDINDPKITVETINARGQQAIGFAADITNDADLLAIVDATEKCFGAISILVNNAAIFASLRLKSFLEISNQEWDDVMRVNARGPIQTARAILPSLERAGGGSIVNISSGSFFYGAPGMMHYVASKGAVIGLTRSMARELGDRNITVNAIAPGLTDSEGVAGHPDMSPLKTPTRAMRALKRDMVPADIIGALLFLTGPGARFVTGQIINVDGGRMMY